MDFLLKWIVEIQDLYFLKNLKRQYRIQKQIMEIKDIFLRKKVDVVWFFCMELFFKKVKTNNGDQGFFTKKVDV